MDPLMAYMNAEDEPTAQEQGAALAAALRRKQELGLLASLSGGRLAVPGRALMGAAGDDQQALMHAGVARTARLDRKAAQEMAGLKDLRDFAARQREQAIDNDRAERGIAAQLSQADAMRGLAFGNFAIRKSEAEAAEEQRKKAAADKAEGEVRELAAKTGDSPAMVAAKAARVREALGAHPVGELPGFGRVTSMLPDAVVSDEGRAIRSDARELVNTLLFLQSGAGVSNQERENKYNAYGLGAGSSEDAFRRGVEVLQNDLKKALEAKQAGFTPETVDTYKKRGGVVPADIAPEQQSAPAGDFVTLIDENGEDLPVSASKVEAVLKKYPKMRRK